MKRIHFSLTIIEIVVAYLLMIVGSMFLFLMLWCRVLPHKEPKEESAPTYMVG